MDIIEDLEEVDIKLAELKKNFNNQMNSIEDDIKEFHKILISLSSKYPEQKEILEFIVFINDKLETNQTEFREVLTTSMNEIINIKREIVKNNIKARKTIIDRFEEKSKDSLVKNLMSKFNTIKDIKWIITVLAFVLAIVGFYVTPDTMALVAKFLSEIGFLKEL